MAKILNISKDKMPILSDGSAMAFDILKRTASILGTKELVAISSGHTDSCLYFGESGLMFAKKLYDLGARVQVPTTTNVGSLDLLHPELILSDEQTKKKSKELLDCYLGFGCQPVYTCAPYQVSNRPALGDLCAWGESNAIAFINSVLGARTNRCGDFIDICCALTGYAPYYGLLKEENRSPSIAISLKNISPNLQKQKIFFPLLGALVGRLAQNRIPIIIDHVLENNEDGLKALGAAAASTGAVGLFHISNVTPEADRYGNINSLEVIEITKDLLNAEWSYLGEGEIGEKVDCVALGSPHFSYEEFEELASLLPTKPFAIPFYVCTSRFVYKMLENKGILEKILACGITIVQDTCVVVTPILKDIRGVLMTNSGKFANYSLPNTGYRSVFGSLSDCVQSAIKGKLINEGL